MRLAICGAVALAVVSLVVGGCGAATTPTPALSPGATAAPSATPAPSANPARPASPTLTRAPSTTPPPLPSPGTAAVQAAQAVRSLFERHNVAWDQATSADAVLALWADDVRFTDLLARWRDEPRATLDQMVREYVGKPGLGSATHSYFVDATGGLDSYDVWGLGDATEASPVHAVDVFETKDGLLTSWHAVYDLRSLARISGRPVADLASVQALIEGYADAWSSGEPSSVAQLYAQAAWRTDTLLGDSAEGRQAISDAAARSFGSYPGAVWHVEIVFGDGPGQVMNGGIFTVRLAEPNGCELGAAVVLETNSEHEIERERVFWELDALVRCGQVSSVVSAVPTD